MINRKRTEVDDAFLHYVKSQLEHVDKSLRSSDQLPTQANLYSKHCEALQKLENLMSQIDFLLVDHESDKHRENGIH